MSFSVILAKHRLSYAILLISMVSVWFMYIKELAKKKGWLIQQINWNKDEGTHLEETPRDLRELIEYQINNNIEAQLGNSIRKFLEHLLKFICFNLEVKTTFRFNEQNEKRMSDELLNELKAKINKKSPDLKSQMVIIDRVANSNVLGNLLSHDNPYEAKIGDLKAFWSDIESFENLFLCKDGKCESLISMKYYDNVKNQIRCSCGKVNYSWIR